MKNTSIQANIDNNKGVSKALLINNKLKVKQSFNSLKNSKQFIFKTSWSWHLANNSSQLLQKNKALLIESDRAGSLEQKKILQPERVYYNSPWKNNKNNYYATVGQPLVIILNKYIKLLSKVGYDSYRRSAEGVVNTEQLASLHSGGEAKKSNKIRGILRKPVSIISYSFYNSMRSTPNSAMSSNYLRKPNLLNKFIDKDSSVKGSNNKKSAQKDIFSFLITVPAKKSIYKYNPIIMKGLKNKNISTSTESILSAKAQPVYNLVNTNSTFFDFEGGKWTTFDGYLNLCVQPNEGRGDSPLTHVAYNSENRVQSLTSKYSIIDRIKSGTVNKPTFISFNAAPFAADNRIDSFRGQENKKEKIEAVKIKIRWLIPRILNLQKAKDTTPFGVGKTSYSQGRGKSPFGAGLGLGVFKKQAFTFGEVSEMSVTHTQIKSVLANKGANLFLNNADTNLKDEKKTIKSNWGILTKYIKNYQKGYNKFGTPLKGELNKESLFLDFVLKMMLNNKRAYALAINNPEKINEIDLEGFSHPVNSQIESVKKRTLMNRGAKAIKRSNRAQTGIWTKNNIQTNIIIKFLKNKFMLNTYKLIKDQIGHQSSSSDLDNNLISNQLESIMLSINNKDALKVSGDISQIWAPSAMAQTPYRADSLLRKNSDILDNLLNFSKRSLNSSGGLFWFLKSANVWSDDSVLAGLVRRNINASYSNKKADNLKIFKFLFGYASQGYKSDKSKPLTLKEFLLRARAEKEKVGTGKKKKLQSNIAKELRYLKRIRLNKQIEENSNKPFIEKYKSWTNSALGITKAKNIGALAPESRWVTKKLLSTIFKLLSTSFKAMTSLISYPIFIITPNKIKIQLFYFIFMPKFLKDKKKFVRIVLNHTKFFYSHISPQGREEKITAPTLTGNNNQYQVMSQLPASKGLFNNKPGFKVNKSAGFQTSRPFSMNSAGITQRSFHTSHSIFQASAEDANNNVKKMDNKITLYPGENKNLLSTKLDKGLQKRNMIIRLNTNLKKSLRSVSRNNKLLNKKGNPADKFLKFKLKLKIRFSKLNYLNFIKIFPKKFNRLCQILSYFFQKPIELDLIRMHYPYNNPNILVNLMGYMVNKIKVQHLIRKTIAYSVFKDIKRTKWNNALLNGRQFAMQNLSNGDMKSGANNWNTSLINLAASSWDNSDKTMPHSPSEARVLFMKSKVRAILANPSVQIGEDNSSKSPYRIKASPYKRVHSRVINNSLNTLALPLTTLREKAENKLKKNNQIMNIFLFMRNRRNRRKLKYIVKRLKREIALKRPSIRKEKALTRKVSQGHSAIVANQTKTLRSDSLSNGRSATVYRNKNIATATPVEKTKSPNPAFLAGMTYRAAGRFKTRRVTRYTTYKKNKGSYSPGKVDFIDFARYTNKSKRGSFSITIYTSHNIY